MAQWLNLSTVKKRESKRKKNDLLVSVESSPIWMENFRFRVCLSANCKLQVEFIFVLALMKFLSFEVSTGRRQNYVYFVNLVRQSNVLIFFS